MEEKRREREVWPSNLADKVCPRPPLVTQVQHFVSRIKKRQRWDVQTMWTYDLDLWPWRSLRSLWLMRVVVLHPYTKFEVGRSCHSEFARCVSALMGLVTLTFDRLILKLVCESHLRWETLLPNSGTLSLWFVELFAMYVTDGRTDEQTDDGGRTKATLIAPSLRGRGHSNKNITTGSIIMRQSLREGRTAPRPT